MLAQRMTTTCCIAGGGPAGVMLGLLHARAGVETIVLERHPDFFQDFRGDTIHPSTIDLLWFRLPRTKINPPDTLAYLDAEWTVITIPRDEYYQSGMLIPKGGYPDVQKAGIDEFRARIVRIAPFLSEVVDSITDWDQVKLLTVQVNRLSRWWQPGLLCIGDAAHAMSPAFCCPSCGVSPRELLGADSDPSVSALSWTLAGTYPVKRARRRRCDHVPRRRGCPGRRFRHPRARSWW